MVFLLSFFVFVIIKLKSKKQNSLNLVNTMGDTSCRNIRKPQISKESCNLQTERKMENLIQIPSMEIMNNMGSKKSLKIYCAKIKQFPN